MFEETICLVLLVLRSSLSGVFHSNVTIDRWTNKCRTWYNAQTIDFKSYVRSTFFTSLNKYYEVVLRTMERMEKKEEDRAKVGECNVE